MRTVLRDVRVFDGTSVIDPADVLIADGVLGSYDGGRC